MESELNDNEIDFGDVLEMDLNKYTDWIFSHTSYSRSKKKYNVFRLMEYQEKTISNYRKYIDVVFNRTKYWQEPTDFERDSFPVWRKMTTKEHSQYFEYNLCGSALSFKKIKNIEFKRLSDLLNSTDYAPTMGNLIDGHLTSDFYKLAEVCGIIDHIQELQSREEKKAINNNVTVLKDEKQPIKLINFKGYLFKEGKEIYPFLLEQFTDCKSPKQIACMIVALKNFNYISEELGNNQEARLTKLHKNLELSFGKIGSRQGLRQALITLGDDKKNLDVKLIIEAMQDFQVANNATK